MRNMYRRAALLVTTILTALLLTPATAVAQCTGGLVNTLGDPRDDGCGGIYPAIGSAVVVAAALGAAALHAVVSYARGQVDGGQELRVNHFNGEFIKGDVRGDVFMKGGTIDGNVYGNVVMWEGATITGNVYGDVVQISSAGANSIGGSVQGKVVQARRISGTITIGGRTIISPVR
ncbi:hypothetical protein IU479_28230 [Nocardia abscessus]|uniref:hypothetical protein n=1 Tax=Nocardia TaxID=1817 RepID=UPI0018963210|nr:MULTISPECIES: hypothetical protein [Nocardia]MBF6221989.1 hypothetical protein [Nocardia abscessus]MDE1674652.1 hypothetical protein [Nocardia gipuzkoensis]